MEQARKSLGRGVIRTKQYLAAIRPANPRSRCPRIVFADEVVRRRTSPGLRRRRGRRRELKMATTLVESLSGPWDPGRYQDDTGCGVLDRIEQKAEGQEIVVQPAAEEPADVVDLMAALEASLERRGARTSEAKRRRGRVGYRGDKGRTRIPAR